MSANAVLNNSGLLAIKTESTPGTAETLTSTEVILPVGDLSYGLDIQTHPNELMQPTFGTEPDFVGTQAADMSFFHLLRASGTAGTAPAMGAMLTLMGLAETVVASTSVTYKPVTPATGSFTFGNWRRRSGSTSTGNIWIGKGAVCAQTKITFEVGKDVRMMHTLKGAFSSVADTAYPTVTFSETGAYFQALMTSMTIGSWAPIWNKLEIVIDYEVKQVDDPGGSDASGIACFEVTDRKTTGSITLLHQAKATKDFMADVQAGTEAALTLSNGASAGDIITVNAAKTQFLNPSFSDDGGLDYVTFPLKFNVNGADNEFSIVLT